MQPNAYDINTENSNTMQYQAASKDNVICKISWVIIVYNSAQ